MHAHLLSKIIRIVLGSQFSLPACARLQVAVVTSMLNIRFIELSILKYFIGLFFPCVVRSIVSSILLLGFSLLCVYLGRDS